MDFNLSSDQEALREVAQRVTRDLFPHPVAPISYSDDSSAADEAWSILGELGWPSLLVPERLGGSGAGLVEACIVTDALSASLAPVPFVGTAIGAVVALKEIDNPASEQLLREIVDGRRIGLALDDHLSWPNLRPASIAWQSEASGMNLLLSDDGFVLLKSSEVLHGADLVNPLRRLEEPGETSRGAAPSERGATWITVATAAALLGTLRGAADLAFQYVGERHQYGDAIGSFQAVQHICADIFVDLESADSALYGAAWVAEHGELGDAMSAARIAKSWCGAAAVRGAEATMQLLGGVGVTWESPAHLFLRQAHGLNASFGSSRAHNRVVGRNLIEGKGRS